MHVGLDWEALREANAQRLAFEEERRNQEKRERDETLAALLGVTVEELNAPPSPPRKAGSRAGVKQKVKRDRMTYARYDWNEIHRLYTEESQTPSQIAKQLGCQLPTIYHALEQKGVDVARLKVGRQPQEKCQNGHELSVHGVPMKQGGRYCRACRRANDSERAAAIPGGLRGGREVACPKCSAQPNDPCRSPTGNTTHTHAARLRAT